VATIEEKLDKALEHLASLQVSYAVLAERVAELPDIKRRLRAQEAWRWALAGGLAVVVVVLGWLAGAFQGVLA